MSYIVTQEEKTLFDAKGKIFGVVEKLALVKSNYLGKMTTVNSYKNIIPCLELLCFDTIEEAEIAANVQNMLSSCFSFKPELVS